ncbi:Tyrosine-protein kinase Yes [Trichoplax sp. H2]|nr:Tyrosine-protein kinase Yes [Trichoplax sp. H2]|eukprot:RDD41322.1 Tyrosine-protein kinase Yes [Trichoplax sp. H2]
MGQNCSKAKKSTVSPSSSTSSIPSPLPLPPQSNIFIGLYDYKALSPQDLSFRKGEPLEILESDGDWWKARSLHTGNEGFVPFNYVQSPNSDLANL